MILFWLLVFLLPVQLGKHFWLQFSYVLGLRIDYLSPTIYLTDILVLVILSPWILKKRLRRQNLKKIVFFLVVFGFLLLNCFSAQNKGAAFYKYFKIIEFTLLGIYIAKKKIKLSKITLPLSLAIIYSSLIAIGQFLKQASLNGIFYWLGERNFDVAVPGIAKTVFQGRLLLRPYATFPHPNVLAGFILVSLILIITTASSRIPRASVPEDEGAGRRRRLAMQAYEDRHQHEKGRGLPKETSSDSTELIEVLRAGGGFISARGKPRRWRGQIEKILKWPTLALGLIAVILSFSRSAWLGGGLAILLSIFFRPITVGIFLFNPNFWQEEFFWQRMELNKAAFQMIKTKPLLGIGLNNFISQLPSFWSKPASLWSGLQPVHNIFLLVAAETGMIGFLIFTCFLFLTFKKLFTVKNKRLLIALSAILLIGFFDHYWFTLQQPQLLLAIVLGLAWQSRKI